MPIAIQAAPPTATGETAPKATSAKKDNTFATLLDQANQTTPETRKSAARASRESPAQKDARGGRPAAQREDGQKDQTSKSSDARSATDLTSPVPIPELSLPIPTPTQGCAANAATVKESGSIVRSLPPVGLKTPNTPVAENGRETVAGPGKQPATQPWLPTALFAETESCLPAGESVVPQSANSTASPKIEPTAVPPKDHDTVLPQLSISNRQAERAAPAPTQADFVHEVPKNPERIAAPAQGLPAVAPPRNVANPAPATDRTLTAKLKVAGSQAASSAPPSEPVSPPTEKPENAPISGREADGLAPGLAALMAARETHDLGVKRIQVVSIAAPVSSVLPQDPGHAMGAELTQAAATHTAGAPKQSVTLRSQETGSNTETSGGGVAAGPSTPAPQLADRPAVPISSPPAAPPVSAHVSPAMHTAPDSSVLPGRDSVLPATEPLPVTPPATGQVHGARLMARPEQAEMRIALQTGTFGNVEVHAVVRESQVGLAIGSERGDLHRMLANEVPGLAGRLQQHDLHLDAVKFLDQGMSFNAGSDGNHSRPRAFSSPRAFAPSSSHSREPTRVPEQEGPAETRTGLNVRA